ncbi:hypothetical protein SAMN05421759_12132 [Roseivivax lentus]|uniref:Uncharacterized protein n=1 Tax=Roseivivax lentus TaxID=633194 RepID=A0A1N7PWG9_9RHOB|nr:hypothetical protein SAMN05421759_12132 [Roseivivax lentus]
MKKAGPERPAFCKIAWIGADQPFTAAFASR